MTRNNLSWLGRWAVLAAAAFVCSLYSASAMAGPVKISEDARKQFRIGVALLQDPAGPRYEEAYGAFKAAYADSPSPKILGNLGLCAMKLERDGEAIDAYEKYLADAPGIKKAERKQIEGDLDVLRGAAVTLRLEVHPQDVVLVDERRPIKGEPVVNQYRISEESFEARIRPGSHRLTLRKEGFEPATVDIDAAPGESVERSIELAAIGADEDDEDEPGGKSPDEPDRPIPVSVYVGLAATGAFAVATGVVGGLSLAHHGKFDDSMDSGDTAEAESLRDDGLVLNITTDVLLGATAVAAGVTAILFFTRPEADAGEPDESARLVVTPIAGPGAGGIAISGSF